jgi:TonB-dependent siderophore receptor
MTLAQRGPVPTLDSEVHRPASSLTAWVHRAGGIAAALGLTLCLVWSSAVAQETGTIRGKVTNQETGLALAGALITLQGTTHRAQTGESGQFTLDAVAGGTYTLAATAIGFARHTEPLQLSPGETRDLEIRMNPVALQLREVVVTASKTETEVRDVPAPVAVVTSADIEKSGATNLTEAVQNAPGVSIGSFGENFNSIQLRGMPRFGSENEGVLILLDGVPETDARNSARPLTISVDNIERVEVVKGPNSALYGRTAIGGVVNVITKDPPMQPEFRGRVQAGQFSYVRGELSAGGPLGSGGRSGYLISGLAGRHDSWHDRPIKRRQSSVFGKITSALDPSTQVTASANFAMSRGGTATGVPIVDGRLLSDLDPSFSWRTNLNLPIAEYNQEEARVMGRVDRSLGPGARVTNTFGYRRTRYDFVDDGDFMDPPPALGVDTVVLYPFTNLRGENAYYNDLRLEVGMGPESCRHRVLVGGTLDKNTGKANVTLGYSDTLSGGVPVDYNNPVYPTVDEYFQLDGGSRTYSGTFYGVYLQDEITVARRLRATVGGRYDYNRLHVPPGPRNADIRANFEKFSPKIGVSYRLLDPEDLTAPQVSVYGQFSRAFRPPRAPASLRTALPSGGLVPEDITNYELGVKATLLKGRAAVELSAFRMTRDGISVLLRTGSGLDLMESNAGQQRFRGIEAGIALEPVRAVSLFANYGFFDGKYGDFTIVQGGVETNLEGLRVNLSPRHTYSIGAGYEPGEGLGLTVSGNYESSKALDAQNTFFLESYFVVNGRANWRWRNYTFGLSVSNLFDTEYANDGEITDPIYIFPAPPRRIIFELGVAY